jgi:hypothetical protein
MSPGVEVRISYGPANASQLLAWERLWARLLAGEPPTPAAPGVGQDATVRGRDALAVGGETHHTTSATS